jgi:hypothetical protein
MWGGFGDGPILTSVEDLFLWDQNFYKNKLGGGGPSLIEAMQAPGRLNNGEILDYGCGLVISEHRGHRLIRHGGSWAGYRSQLLRFPDMRFSVIVLANLSSLDPTEHAFKVADLWLVESPANEAQVYPAAKIEILRADLEALAGFYRCERTEESLELVMEAESLTAVADGELFPLQPESQGLFFSAGEKPETLQIEVIPVLEEQSPELLVKFEYAKAEHYSKLPASPTLSADQLTQYCGVFHSSEIPAIYLVFQENDQLYLKRGYAKPRRLHQITEDQFQCDEVHISFEGDNLGQIQKFLLGCGRIQQIPFYKL